MAQCALEPEHREGGASSAEVGVAERRGDALFVMGLPLRLEVGNCVLVSVQAHECPANATVHALELRILLQRHLEESERLLEASVREVNSADDEMGTARCRPPGA